MFEMFESEWGIPRSPLAPEYREGKGRERKKLRRVAER